MAAGVAHASTSGLRRCDIAKGDKITVGLDVGGVLTSTEIVADKAGREVQFNRNTRDDQLTVEVVGRAGSVARTYFFKLSSVVLFKEEKAGE
jgi:hypothetical protein